MSETWKDVVGYEGIYEVSSLGKVRTHKDKTTYTKRHGVRRWKQRFLKNRTPNGRDVRVTLWKNGKPKDFLVHRLVGFAFIPTIKGKECINHIDGNSKNNCVENLEWCNHSENNNHAFETGLMSTNMNVKLINEIGIEYEFISMNRASEFLGRSNGYISRNLKNNNTKLTDIHGNKYRVEKLI
ncbi:NUMOD4 motif-containing protein/HNH endonuclease [Staphylococcus haemolyticus]|uniref:NUMOD4 domain-containing protein n=1 Tax=Staphylococcus TaxID=1279 RepID=UPI0008A8D939|nr:NUMOD4 domain-containing protein [Staphylococcus sp. HMSC057G10]OHO94730.1 HNH endonuclease [Staphylococcus sp. HMSC057G10]